VNDSLWTQRTRITAAPLKGVRSIFQRDHLRPRCPHCTGILRPGELLTGWDPAVRDCWVLHKKCNKDWYERDPAPIVAALQAYYIAARDGEGSQPYLHFTMRRLAALRVEFPVYASHAA